MNPLTRYRNWRLRRAGRRMLADLEASLTEIRDTGLRGRDALAVLKRAAAEAAAADHGFGEGPDLSRPGSS